MRLIKLGIPISVTFGSSRAHVMHPRSEMMVRWRYSSLVVDLLDDVEALMGGGDVGV
jgi:hypothetical protein